MKLKHKTIVQAPRNERVKLNGENAALVDEYAAYYEATYQSKINTADLLAEIATAFIKSDRDFIKWRRQTQSSIGPTSTTTGA